MVQLTKNELEEIINELEKYKGRHTELITVYIPAGQNLYTVVDQLQKISKAQEQKKMFLMH